MQQEAGIAAGTSGEATREKLEAITARVGELLDAGGRSSSPPSDPDLAAAGIGSSNWDDLDDEDRATSTRCSTSSSFRS